MFPTFDLAVLLQPVTWIVFGVAGVAGLVGWRLASKTYWRVLLAVGLGIIGGTYFYDGLGSNEPPGEWAGQGALMILGAGLLLDRARRLRKLERLGGR